MTAPTSTVRLAWSALLVAFAALNVWALTTDGLAGFLTYLGGLGPIGILATADLLLALLVGGYFIVRDARSRARDARPFLLLTLATGSLGLLAYLARHGGVEGAASESPRDSVRLADRI